MNLSVLNEEEAKKTIGNFNLVAYSNAFARFAELAYGSKRFFVGIKEAENIKATFPVFKKIDYGQEVAEVPLFIYTEPIFSDKNFRIKGQELGRALRKFLGCDVVRLNICPFFYPNNFDISGMEHKFSAMITDLRDVADYEEFLMKKLSRNARSKVYKSQSVGLRLAELKRKDFDRFFALYSRHVRGLGSKPRPKEYFQNIFDSYSQLESPASAWKPGFQAEAGGIYMFGTEKESELISANLFVVNGNYLEVKFLADDRRYSKLFANNFLYSEMFKWAFSRGIKLVDFGGIPAKMRSNIEFKTSFGAKEYPIYTKYFFKNWWQKMVFKVSRKFLYFKKYAGRKIL